MTGWRGNGLTDGDARPRRPRYARERCIVEHFKVGKERQFKAGMAGPSTPPLPDPGDFDPMGAWEGESEGSTNVDTSDEVPDVWVSEG